MNYTRHDRRRLARRLDYQNASVADILAVMRDGATLHLHHTARCDVWWLSTGKVVAEKIARLVIINPLVVPADDALFAGPAPQTYRYRFPESAALPASAVDR